MFSCKKEDVTPVVQEQQQENEACKCGVIQSQSYSFTSNEWRLTVSNNCSGNNKVFTDSFSQQEGAIYCVNESW